MGARLEMLAGLVPACETVADIGADHGQLGALLLNQGKCGRVIACDSSAKALEKARGLYARLGFGEKAEVRVGDGLSVLFPGEAQTIVIAGMGAGSIAGILRRGKDVAEAASLVLSPTIGVEDLRGFLQEEGYALRDERLCLDGGRWRVGLLALPGEMKPFTEEELLVGRYLSGEEGYMKYLQWRVGVLSRVRTDAGRRALDIVTRAIGGK